MHCLILVLGLLLMGCGKEEQKNRATGVFEATEVTISAETPGRLLDMKAEEGQAVQQGQFLGQLDTLQLHLSKLQVEANQLSILAGKPNTAAEIRATQRELEKLNLERERTEKLLAGGVATEKQLDDLVAKIQVLEARLNAQRTNLSASSGAVDAQYEAMAVQIEQLEEQIDRCALSAPIDGVVLNKYYEKGEFVGAGMPLFKIADVEHMILRAYLNGEQLSGLQLGQEVSVEAEMGSTEYQSYTGQVTWISEKAEFTPKTIQTQDERANLVYAIKVSVVNDGNLKIGMYASVKWGE